MALRMGGALYDALRQSPGTPEEAARLIAEEVANYDNKIAIIQEEAARLAAEEVANYDNKIAIIQSDLNVVKWMLGAVIALVFLVLGKVW